MAFTATMLRSSTGSLGSRLGYYRLWSHLICPSPLDRAIDRTCDIPFVLPGFDRESNGNTRIDAPNFSSVGSMELMAVPKKKVSPHKRGIRNGPKALKPIPVIIRCNYWEMRNPLYIPVEHENDVDGDISNSWSCGRVKLPHFYCCSGEREIPGKTK